MVIIIRDGIEGAEGLCFFFQAEDGIRDDLVTGVQTCALPISRDPRLAQFRGLNVLSYPGGEGH